MSLTSIYRSRWVLSLCVVLSMALALQGAPTSRSPNLQGSERNSAPIHPKSSGKVGFPLLPPDEDMGTMKLESEKMQEDDFVSADGPISEVGLGIPLLPPDEDMGTMKLESEKMQEDDFVSADGPISEFGSEEISGDNPIDYSDYLIPGPVKKPTIFEGVKPRSNE